MSGKIKAWFRKFRKSGRDGNNKPKKVVDPVCNMKIEPGIFSSDHGGKTYYFCSEYCKAQFDADPAQYI
ncbi:MAG: YHS domain-containing protein [Candidatus Doudnabacteria bacterium]|jgi:YHS domain-containing protein